MVGQKGDVNLEVEYPIDKRKCCIIYVAQPMLGLIYININIHMWMHGLPSADLGRGLRKNVAVCSTVSGIMVQQQPWMQHDATHESNIRCESNLKRAANVARHPLFSRYLIPSSWVMLCGSNMIEQHNFHLKQNWRITQMSHRCHTCRPKNRHRHVRPMQA